MNSFLALVTEDVKANRLLSLIGGNGVPRIAITPAGGEPDYRSTIDLKANEEITVSLENNPIWGIEAGEDIGAGAYVEVGEKGKIVASDGEGIGYITEGVKNGEVASFVRKASGGAGKKGPKGDPGPAGPAGPKGATGAAGKDGATGAAGKGVKAIALETTDGAVTGGTTTFTDNSTSAINVTEKEG